MTPQKQAQAATYKHKTEQLAPRAKAEVVEPDPQQPAPAPASIARDPVPVEPASDEPTVPWGVEEDDDTSEPEPDAAPPPKEYVILGGLASFGPVRIGGKLTRTVKGKLYYVPDVRERVAILGTGRFRAATKADLFKAGTPSAGPGGAITRDILPPGALKGGSVKP